MKINLDGVRGLYKKLFCVQAPPREPVFCVNCKRYDPSRAPNYFRCKIKERIVEIVPDFVNGGTQERFHSPEYRCCGLYNSRGTCEDYIPKDQECSQ